MVKGAWVTLATNDSYSLGALVLAHSLKQVGTQQELAILVTPGVTNPMRERLSDVFNIVKEVNVLDSRDKANLRLLQRPELGITFTKLHCWQLTQYEKCVFLDADTLVLQNCDELFEREELSAAPDVGWPDCFNSGVFVYRPSEDTYNSLIQFALDKGSFDGGDQGLLNLYFSDWARKDISKHLPFIYNVCSTAFYSYLPAFKQFGKDVKIIHFIGNAKPWLQYFDTESKKVRPSRDLGHLEPILQQWWNLFCSMIHPNLSPDMISSYPSDHVSARSPDQSPQQPYIAPPSPIECTNDIRPNFWDPWEEYDRNQMSSGLYSLEHLEPHNTIALSSVAPDHSCIEHSNTSLDVPSVDRHNQHETDSSTTHVEHSHDDQNGIEIVSESNPNENNYVEDCLPPSNDNHEDVVSHVNIETVQESLRTSPVPSYHEKSLNHCEVSISGVNPNYSTIPGESFHETEDALPIEIHLPVSHIPEESSTIPEQILISHDPSKYETEEDSNNVPCEVENHVNESGLAGAFAKLTLGQHRTPEQEALEDSLRRQNWEQGNIDYLGKDSFDNIWSKICETLSKGPQENEEVKGLELPPSQQETSAPTKEDVLSAPQETPLSADPISPLPPVTVSSDNIPTESEASPKREPSPQDKSSSESVPSATPKAEETSQSEIVLAPVQRPASETSSPAKPVEEIPLLGAKTPESVSVSVEQASSGSLPPTKEVSTPDTDPIPTKQTEVSSSPVAELSAPPKEIAEQETSVEKVLPASQSVPSAPQAPPTEQVASAPHKVSAEESVCPLEAAPQVEGTPALKVTPSSPASQEIPESPKVAPTKQSSIFDKTSCAFPKAATPSVEIADPPSTQITKATSEPARIPSEKLSSEEIPQTAPVKELISQLEQFPSDRSSPPEEVTVPSDKPSPPKEPKTPSDKASPPKEAMAPSEKPSPPNETKVPLDTASPPKEAKAPSDKPSPPKETKVPSDKPSPPKEAKVLSDKPSPPKEAKVPSDKTSPPKEAKVPSDKFSPPKEAPSSPTQTAPSKPEQIPPKEIPQPEDKVTFSPTQIAPLKVAASAPEGPSTTALEQVSIPPSAETTSISTSPFVSSEPPPPITPPPRKSGGNKKQSKPKK